MRITSSNRPFSRIHLPTPWNVSTAQSLGPNISIYVLIYYRYPSLVSGVFKTYLWGGGEKYMIFNQTNKLIYLTFYLGIFKPCVVNFFFGGGGWKPPQICHWISSSFCIIFVVVRISIFVTFAFFFLETYLRIQRLQTVHYFYKYLYGNVYTHVQSRSSYICFEIST